MVSSVRMTARGVIVTPLLGVFMQFLAILAFVNEFLSSEQLNKCRISTKTIVLLWIPAGRASLRTQESTHHGCKGRASCYLYGRGWLWHGFNSGVNARLERLELSLSPRLVGVIPSDSGALMLVGQGVERKELPAAWTLRALPEDLARWWKFLDSHGLRVLRILGVSKNHPRPLYRATSSESSWERVGTRRRIWARVLAEKAWTLLACPSSPAVASTI